MPYQLNQRALEALKALVRAGKYVDRAWSFSAKDSNALLGEPPNWTVYQQWFLGVDGSAAEKTKAKYAYPFGKGGVLYLSALREIVSRAAQQGDNDIARAASEALSVAEAREADRAQASAVDSDRELELVAPVSIAAAAGDDGQPAGLPKFEMTAYTGGPMRLRGWIHPVVVDLKGVGGLDKPRPILKDHDQSKAVGHSEAGQIKVSDRDIKAEGVISGHGAHVDEVVNSSKNKFPWQASIGARVLKQQFVPEGEEAAVNGRVVQGPVHIARKTVLGEISFVALGADDNTSARIAAHAAAKGSKMTFEQWLEAKGIAADGLTDAVKNVLKAQFDAEQKLEAKKAKGGTAGGDEDEGEEDDVEAAAADDDEDDDDEGEDEDDGDDEDDDDAPPAKKAKDKSAKGKSAKGKKASARRVNLDLEAMADRAIQATRKAQAKEQNRIAKVQKIAAQHPDIAAKAIAQGWDEGKTELEVLRADRPKGNGVYASSFGINTGAGTEPTVDIVAAACARAGGVGEKAAFAGLSDKQKEIADSKQVRKASASIYGLCSLIAAAHGVRLPSPRMDGDVLAAMQRIERQLDIEADGGSGAISTMSLSGITENILNKAMMEAYGTVDSVVSDICFETDTNDFKQFKRYRLTASGVMSALGAAGELKAISLQDESYPNQVKTQGVILNVGRELLTNDDMGALTQAPTLLGRGAALYREMIVFAIYLGLRNTVAPGASTGQAANAFNFFSSGAGNLLTGAPSALQISAVTSAVKAFREQTDANSMPIMLKPDRLLVPPALEVTADNLFNGANLVVGALGSTSSKSVEPNINAHKGK